MTLSLLCETPPALPCCLHCFASTALKAAERRSVFVARSRYQNGVERTRGTTSYGILRQPAPLGKHIRERMRWFPAIPRRGWEGVERRASAGGGAREAGGRDATARSPGPCGSPGAPRAA